MPASVPENPDGNWRTASSLTLGVGCATIVMALLLFSLVVAFVSVLFRYPSLGRLRDAEELIALFANLAVVFYAFPAFTRTKKRAFLAMAFAGLSFAYTALFTLLLSAGPPATATHDSRAQIQWYYATWHVVEIVGLILYAYAGVSLARSAASSDPKA
jgi:hypothetical protein